MVGRQHPTHEGGNRILHTDVGGGVVAEQQGRKRRFDRLRGIARLPIQHLEQVAEGAHPHGFCERDRVELAIGAEPDHHRSTGFAPSPFLVVVGEEHNSGRALRSGIEAEAMAHREFTVDELAVDQGLGPGDGILQVVTHQHRFGDEAQIHGLAAHLQARGRPGLERLALPTAEQAEGHFLLGGIGNGAGVVDHRCHGGAQRGHGVHRLQPGRLGAARGEKIDDCGEMRRTVAECSVLDGHDIETSDAGDGAGGPGHRAVARWRSEHF